MSDQQDNVIDPYEMDGPETEISHGSTVGGGPAVASEAPRQQTGAAPEQDQGSEPEQGPTRVESGYAQADESAPPEPPSPDNNDPNRPSQGATGLTHAEDADGPGVPGL